MARPTTYKAEYNDKADEYLKQETGLPTVYAFAQYINTPKTTIYEWAKKHTEFSYSLERINCEQEESIINKGLSGEYNATIAKLILTANHGYTERKDITTNGADIVTPNITITFKDD